MRRVNYSPGLFLYLSAAVLILPLPWLIALILATIIHECGHIAALLTMKIPVCSISLGICGAKINTAELSTKQELIAAGAGPLAGIITILLFPWIPKTALCALVQTVFNLLPIGTFDGARIFRCLIAHNSSLDK